MNDRRVIKVFEGLKKDYNINLDVANKERGVVTCSGYVTMDDYRHDSVFLHMYINTQSDSSIISAEFEGELQADYQLYKKINAINNNEVVKVCIDDDNELEVSAFFNCEDEQRLKESIYGFIENLIDDDFINQINELFDLAD